MGFFLDLVNILRYGIFPMFGELFAFSLVNALENGLFRMVVFMLRMRKTFVFKGGHSATITVFNILL